MGYALHVFVLFLEGVDGMEAEVGGKVRRLECHAHFESDAPLVGVGVVEVGESAHVVNFDEFEDVVYAESEFHVGAFGVHADGVLLVGAVGHEVAWEVEEFGVGVA